MKWSRKYQDKYGIRSCEARNLPDGVVDHIQHLAKRVYRALGLSGYARIDMRMDKGDALYVIEANPILKSPAAKTLPTGGKSQPCLQRPASGIVA